MKKFLNIVFLFFVLLTSFVVFFPKEKLYYLLEEKLLAYSVTLETQEVKSNPFSLDIQNTHILLAGSQIASFRGLNISIFGATAKDVKTVGAFANKLPHAKSIKLDFGISKIGVVKGSFGEILAILDVFERKITLEAKINSATKNRYRDIFAQFKKQGDKYVYNYSF